MTHRVLQITNKPPFPLVDGGCLGMAKMSKFYANNSNFEIDILTLETFKHPFNESFFYKNLPDKVLVTSVFIETKPTFYGAIKELLKNKSYNLSRFQNEKFKQKLIAILKSREYDFIQLENIFVASFINEIRQLSKAKIILNSANIEYEIWERMASKATFPKKNYFQILARQLKKEEEKIWLQSDGIICATDKDKDTIKKIVSENNLVTIPFYLDLHSYSFEKKPKKETLSFFHLGAMDWLPNVEGVNWFITQVWHKLNKSASLHLAGKDMPDKIREFGSDTIQVNGFVEDAKQYMSTFDVMVVPVLSGSGIRVKIIEAMALGKCIISTSVGAEGIAYTQNKNILIADTADEFLKKIVDLIQNPSKINVLGENARKLVEEKYNLTLMEEKLVPFLTHII